ncbi:helix-turn-helix domain-containing protein [Sphaerisporangium melleum]|uniref:Transcriptional regulator n=1 Tax=Sphaerisporangium melleum TaxID=321316 RepID=A0A917QSS5_9ACTN|nr:helix-turn-helix domain-containing protein [Sphaerisporangium melleum]GGK66719.1 transcriptional regulator [Sphaerisporangium melleum]
MVKNGHEAIPEIRYVPSEAGTVGVEVMTIAELRRRMHRHGEAEGARDAEGAGRAQRPDFHLLLTVEQGLLWHMVDFADHAVTDSTWLWVRPAQVQRFGDLSAATGTLVLFQPDFLDPATAGDVRLDDPFGRTLWQITAEDAPALRQALDHLAHEYGTTRVPAPTRSAILQRLLAVLLLRLTHSAAPAGTPPAEHTETFQRFRAAVETNFTWARDVGHYARVLGYSPRTLTRAALAAAGVGAKEFIDRRVVLEAKRLLAHGDEPVGSIGARLGFLDTSNFVKYFDQRTGTTPAAFRSRYRPARAGR